MRFPWQANNSNSIGQRAEQDALNFLRQQGLTLVTRNYQCRLGEIDLVMKDRQVLIFIEVRYRKSAQFGSSAETVNASKQQKLIRTAEYFLLHEITGETPACRFDVVAICPSDTGQNSLQFDWIKHAFEA